MCLVDFIFQNEIIKSYSRFDKMSTINWCEKDYVIPYIAEFWNTASMLPWLVFSIKGLFNTSLRSEIRISYLLSTLVAIGSTLFHATLSRWGQNLDEIAMIYFGIWGIHIAKPKFLNSLESVTLGAFCSLFYFFLSYNSFIILYIIILGTNMFLFFKLNPIKFGPGLLVICLSCILWFIEFLGGICTYPVTLHSFWHLGMGYSIHLILSNL